MQKIFICGGLGHIGLSLAAVISKFYLVKLFDLNNAARDKFNVECKASFYEPGINELLLKNKDNISIVFSLEDACECDIIIVTLGTYIDEYLNPVLKHVFSLFKQLTNILTNQTVIIRSTMYPGMTKKLEKLFIGSNVSLAFCPERVQSGNMISELQTIPQIISANNEKALLSASEFFRPLGVKQKILNDTTAGELSKMMTNAYRYIDFAIANQFFEMSLNAECDFYQIHDAIVDEYPRLRHLAKPGFSSGSCIRKDSLQLASWYNKTTFSLGYDASLINEGLPLFIFRKMRDKFPNLVNMTIGLLGMAFKSNCDDIRDSLSYRMKKILENEVAKVLCSDPFVIDNSFVSTDELIEYSDIIILMTPHDCYRDLNITKLVVDIWNFFGKGIGL